MKFHQRRRPVVIVAGTALAAAVTALGASPAPAAPQEAVDQHAAVAQGQAGIARAEAGMDDAAATRDVARDLGARAAGIWFDAARDTMVLNVTTEAAADQARQDLDGEAVVQVVAHSTAELGAVTDRLTDRVSTPGTAWAVDPAANQVSVTLDSTVSKAAAAKVRKVVAGYGDAVTVERTGGTLSPTVAGGQAIYGGGGRCSLGFNVRSGTTYYFLTAGHCTNLGTTWYSNSGQTSQLGTRAGTSFPGNDYGIVRYTTTQGAGTVYLYNGTSRDITGSGSAYVGQSVLRSGSTTGVWGGTVSALNATVNYAEGSVSGLIRTNVCAEQGDSGGSLFAGNTALGLTSGGSGNCSSGGTTYFQPVTEALGAYGVSVY